MINRAWFTINVAHGYYTVRKRYSLPVSKICSSQRSQTLMSRIVQVSACIRRGMFDPKLPIWVGVILGQQPDQYWLDFLTCLKQNKGCQSAPEAFSLYTLPKSLAVYLPYAECDLPIEWRGSQEGKFAEC
jgi:hypothetical protein